MAKNPGEGISFTRFLSSALQPFYWQVAAIIFVACYWALHASLQPYVIKMILNQAATDPSILAMLNPLIFYIILSLGTTFNSQLYEFACIHFYPYLKTSILAKTTAHINNQAYTFFQNNPSGTLANKVKDLAKGTADIVQIFFDQFFSHALSLLGACIALVMIHPLLSVIFFFWAVTFIIVSFVSTRRARVLAHHLSESNSTIMGHVVDCFTNTLSLKLFASHKYEEEELEKKLTHTIGLDQKLRWFLLKVITLQGVITTIMISGCLTVLVFSIESHHITIGDFGLVLTLTLSIADAIWNLSQEISKFSESYGLVIQGITLLNVRQEIQNQPDAPPLLVTNGRICFEKVCFRYKGAEPLFSEKSIIIEPGQKVGLVGYSGGGKSTFASLILRLFDVQSGHILIDDQDITQVSQKSLHEAITMIPQTTTLFHRTILENIRYGSPHASNEAVIEAAKKAYIHDFIMQLPQQYDTLVGERGGKLSGGQQQRIAIARAFLKNTQILILDEATSALDTITEKLIQQSLVGLTAGKTTLIIAHRLSTILTLDRVLVFNQGTIIEDGPHESLLHRGGFYKRLWDTQVSGFIPDVPR